MRPVNSVTLSLFFVFFLAGCQLKKSEFSLPQAVEFQGKTYTQATHNQIEQMQQALYLPTSSLQDPNNWQQGVLFFLDQTDNLPLAKRLANRQKAYATQTGTKVKIAIKNNELQSEIAYPPTERFHDVQLEVTRGRDLPCGYAQMQFSQKLAVEQPNKRGNFAKNLPNSTARYLSALSELATQFARLPWQIQCR